MFMTEEKQNIQHTPFPPEEERRTEYVGAKVTPDRNGISAASPTSAA